MWVRAVADSQGLNNGDLNALKQIAYNIGDDVLTGKENLDEGHGLGATRQKWFEAGLGSNGSIGQCNTYTVPDRQVR
jgi:predicted metalloprotease